MGYSISQLVKDFQTLIVGALGFTGVALTLLVNAKSSRKATARQIEHETHALRTALIAELDLIRTSFQGRGAPSISGEQPTGAFFPVHTPQPVFENLIGQVGLLSEKEVSAVIRAYTLINEASQRLQILSFGHDPSFDRPGYIYIRAEHEKTASSIFENFLPAIEEALLALRED
ncbi:hypothetical protein FE236_09380 [Mariprofundus erugo]|uniref:hypothetical protein n=1 Tax=Mariprofundus erugo TaxID=2528639 RepID=UPI0010FE090A|nr:hypothetical protein [Mariprofundus erugo]TLS75295.1 hypothetical protein FE236_09380 [Mariprofundus erugo]